MRKLLDFFKLLKKIRHEVKVVKPQLVYVTPNACGGAFYKDFVVVQMLKRLGCQVVVHYHNKGVATRQEKWLDDVLYKRFFKGIKVILLSECLYEDVKKYVDRGDVLVCGNGIPSSAIESLVSASSVMTSSEDKVPHLLFLSNLLISKGVVVLLDSLKVLKEKGCLLSATLWVEKRWRWMLLCFWPRWQSVGLRVWWCIMAGNMVRTRRLS